MYNWQFWHHTIENGICHRYITGCDVVILLNVKWYDLILYSEKGNIICKMKTLSSFRYMLLFDIWICTLKIISIHKTKTFMIFKHSELLQWKSARSMVALEAIRKSNEFWTKMSRLIHFIGTLILSFKREYIINVK